MAHISNGVISLINAIFLIFGLIALGTGIYTHVHDVNQCQKLMQIPLMVVGFFVFVMALLGLMGLCCRDDSLLMVYLGVIFFVIVGLTGFTVFAFLVTHKGSGFKTNPRLGFKEYRLQDFSKWLQTHVVDQNHWVQIKNCLMIDSEVCKALSHNVSLKESDFYKMKLTSIQSGCCKPPTSCKLQYKNATFWTIPKAGVANKNESDCRTWNNKQEVLCYDCNSCKAGVLAQLRYDFKFLAMYNILTVCFLMLVYFIGCCARRNNKYRYVKYSPYTRS